MMTEPEEYRLFALWMFFFLVIGWCGGWIAAHQTVATECRRLGKFYVGSTVFECKAIEPEPEDQTK